MKWKVKIFLAPFVQEEPEEFEAQSFEEVTNELNSYIIKDIYGRSFSALRKVEINKVSEENGL